MKSAKDLPRWRVTVIAGARALEITELQAETAEAAIKRAIREHGIEPEQQKRLGAYRVRLMQGPDARGGYGAETHAGAVPSKIQVLGRDSTRARMSCFTESRAHHCKRRLGY